MSKHEIIIRKREDGACGYIVRIDRDGEQSVVTPVKYYTNEDSAMKALSKKLARIASC